MAITPISFKEIAAITPMAVPKTLPKFATDRCRRDFRQFLKGRLECAEVVGVVPDDPTTRDIDHIAHSYRKQASTTPGITVVQRGRRVFILRDRLAEELHKLDEGKKHA